MNNKKVTLIILVLLVIIVVSGIVGSEYYTSRPEFCGSCHIMKNYYDSWKQSKHGDEEVACIECHYAPGEKGTLKVKFKGLGQLFSYLAETGKSVRKITKVPDESCMTSECHPREKFLDKKIQYTEKIPYVHKTHDDKTIEGQALHCDSCHQHVRPGKHFQVPEVSCYLCHFKNIGFNEGRGRCALCHKIPTKPLQKQKPEEKTEEKPITHQSLEKAKVPCWSCHYALIQGAGDIKQEDCFDCHLYSTEMLKKAGDKKLMHETHVAAQNADCFDCHMPIQHKETDFLDPVRLNCEGCHPNHHIYQRMLLAGEKRKGVQNTPSLMYDVKTTCLGCHREEKTLRGEKVVHGSAQACVACHTEKHEGMVKEWKEKTDEELTYAKEIEKEAQEAVINAEGRVPQKTLKKAGEMLREGQEIISIVEYGGGVHNRKYSIMLLDVAMNNFEDLIDLLSESEGDLK